MKTIYHDRKPLRLKSTRLSLVCELDLAPPNLSRAAVTLATLVVILTAIGGFGIIGSTEQAFENVRVRNKVVAANGIYVDFRDHISKDGNLVSGTFLLLERTTCSSSDIGVNFVFGRINDLQDVTSVEWPRDTAISNSTCLHEDSGFKEEIILQEQAVREEIDLRGCRPYFNMSDVPKNDITQLNVSENIDDRDCPFRVLELWCSNHERLRCAGSLKMARGFGEILYFHGREGGLAITVSLYRAKEQQDSEMLKSMAFISDFVMRGVFLDSIRRMSMTRIETNVLVEKISGERNVTDVNVPLVALTFGTAVLITLITGLSAYTGWTLYVAKAGRRMYNKFNSASDALSCVSFAVFGDGEISGSRKNSGIFLRATDCFVRPERVNKE